ncbi:MAG TPA: RNase adapter RapZ [Candidatus Binatia bacterium]|nr:RNase adapter RapZ [Candidatus Binatia bacterium]
MSLVAILCSPTRQSELSRLVMGQGYTPLTPRGTRGRLSAQVEVELERHPNLVLIASTASGASMLTELDSRSVRYWLLAVGEVPTTWRANPPRAPHRTILTLDPAGAGYLEQLLDDWKERPVPRIDCFPFSFREGLPAEADWVIDTRFLDSPYWSGDLRTRSPSDTEMRDYVVSQPGARLVLDNFSTMLVALLPHYKKQRRTVLRVAVGCTGGEHRSQVMTDELVERLSRSGQATARRLSAPPLAAPSPPGYAEEAVAVALSGRSSRLEATGQVVRPTRGADPFITEPQAIG